MIIFARREDESIMIGDDIEIRIQDITIHESGGVEIPKVRLAINAPRNISIHRKEIWEIIQSEKTAKAKENENGKHHPTTQRQ